MVGSLIVEGLYFYKDLVYNVGMEQAGQVCMMAEPVRVHITERGKHALATDGTEMRSMEARTLIMLVRGPLTALELVTAVRQSDREYAFLAPKFVSNAVGELFDRGYVEYIDPNPPAPEPQRKGKRRR